MDTEQILISTLSTDAFTPVNKKLARKLWFITAGFLWELIRLGDMFKKEHWVNRFYYSQKQMTKNIWLSEYMQRQSYKQLEELNLISVEQERGLHTKNFYTIRYDNIMAYLSDNYNHLKIKEVPLKNLSSTTQKLSKNHLKIKEYNNNIINNNIKNNVSKLTSDLKDFEVSDTEKEKRSNREIFETQIEKVFRKGKIDTDLEKSRVLVWFARKLLKFKLVTPEKKVELFRKKLEKFEFWDLLLAMWNNQHNNFASWNKPWCNWKWNIDYLLKNYKWKCPVEMSINREINIWPTKEELQLLDKIKNLVEDVSAFEFKEKEVIWVVNSNKENWEN